MSILNELPITRAIATMFEAEIHQLGGTVTDTFDDGARLFVRSTLPAVQEVRPRDRIQGGVALRATEREVWVHPYLFRQVCTNGAIMAQAIQTRHVELSIVPDADEESIREAVRLCATTEAFEASADQMRGSLEVEADTLINLLPLLSRMTSSMSREVLSSIMRRFVETREQSRFALMNAVTSVARDRRDPEVRWRLEELGGGIPLTRPGPRRPRAAAAKLTACVG